MADKPKAPKKQTTETLDSVCQSLRSGISFTRSCKISGISKQTGHAWRNSGWREIDGAADDLEGPISFVARFALETELALADFMRPLIERMRDGASGKGKGDWRAAKELLASRFPDEWSEKVATAKSGRLELSGQVDVAHEHSYSEFVALQKLTKEELRFEIERLQGQTDHAVIEGDALAAEIGFHQAKLAAMIEAHGSQRSFSKSNWITGRGPAVRAVAPPSPDELPVIDIEEYLAADPLPSGTAPIMTGDAALSGVASPVAPSPSRTQVGVGFDPARGSVPIYADQIDQTFDDEDLSL